MRICTMCNKEKELDQFGTYYHSTQQKLRIRHQCKECSYTRSRQWKKLNRTKDPMKDFNPDIFEGWVEQQPGDFSTEEQKQQFKIFMKCMLGWNFNEKLNIYYKEGFRSKDGTFQINLSGTGKRKYTKYSKTERQKLIPRILELRERGLTLDEVGEKFNISKSVVDKWLRNYNEKRVR